MEFLFHSGVSDGLDGMMGDTYGVEYLFEASEVSFALSLMYKLP